MKTYTVHPAAPLSLAAPVATIEPLGNTITVIANEDTTPTIVTGDEVFDAEAAGALRVVAGRTARINVTFVDEVDANPRAVRGSSTAGDTGSYESRTVDELYAEAKAKDVYGRSGMNKAQLIDALRAAE